MKSVCASSASGSGEFILPRDLFLKNLLVEKSFKIQIADSRLSAVTVRAAILSGMLPRPQIGPGLPKPFPGTMADLIDGVHPGECSTVRETVNQTLDAIDYNALVPFNKTAKQILEGKSFLETRIYSRNEEKTGSTCIGMSHILVRELRDRHGIEGMYASRRKNGKIFEHAAVIVECLDGYVLIEPRSHPDYRMFSIPFHQSLTVSYKEIFTKIFTAAHPGSQTPISQKDRYGEFEFCVNIANGDDLVTKYFIMHAPFDPPENPALCLFTFYLEGDKMGHSSRIIFVSPLQATLTLKNDTIEEGPERTIVISFKEVLKNDFYAQLKRFCLAGNPLTFNISLKSLHEQLIQFVTNADIIDKMFHEIWHHDTNR